MPTISKMCRPSAILSLLASFAGAGMGPIASAFLPSNNNGAVSFTRRRTTQQPLPTTMAHPPFISAHRATSLSKSRTIFQIGVPTFCRIKSQQYAAAHDAAEDDEFVEAEDLEALQALFARYCDKEGLMTKEEAKKVPPIAELLAGEDLLPQEFDDIWDRAPKFPDTIEKNGSERIDVDSFVQVYRDIDDLFETEEEDDDRAVAPTKDSNEEKIEQSAVDPGRTPSVADNGGEAFEDDKDDSFEAELESIFEQICDKKTGLVNKTVLKDWDEIQKLLAEGLIGEDEFDDLWSKTKKSNGGSSEQALDVEGFLSFNVALDDLFDFDDEEMEDDEDDEEKEEEEEGEAVAESAGPELRMVEGEDLPPDVLFVSLADENGLVGFDELKRWQELSIMINDGDLAVSELEEIFRGVKKSEMDLNKIEEEGFVALCRAIDDLFEEISDEEDDDNRESSSRIDRKAELLDAISDLEVEGLLPCGLEATDREQREILSIVEQLEQESSNLIRSQETPIEPRDLDGTWELLYSSSSAMKFNKGLSGLGGSFPNGRFGNLKQKLTASKFLTDVEYIEHIEVTPSNASFDVTVTGTWDLRTSVSLFTGEPSVVLTVQPDRVTYGPTSTRADHWKSLGPMNMLDISYLDEDLRIMRGNTSVETVFVFRRIS